MIKLGEWNELEVVKEKDFGIYLSDQDRSQEVLLPRKEVPAGTKIGDSIKVFIYKDSSDRIIATVATPYITMGEMACLKCVGITKIGAFMDWGLPKDILMPFKEQKGKVEEGREYLVRMYKDRSDRLCVSMKVYTYLSTASPYHEGDEVSGIVYEFNPQLGAFVAVDNQYSALVPMKEIHSRINVGDRLEARVANIREDGKLNLTIQKPIKRQMEEDAEMVYKIIESYDGRLPFNDKADKETIEREFGLSKNAFKRAVGRLLKQGRIEITDKNILLK
ncbi:MAG: S1 RNA-binding domain-containing protein [Coprococcus sp.]|nr:S1 RNA-binding domain-containing protein [Coprococcus sp.]